MTDSNIASAYGHLLTARLHLQIAVDQDGETYALSDALSLIEDAISQTKGEMQNREDERPGRYDWMGGAA